MTGQASAASADEAGDGFRPLLEYLKASRGFDFSGYKPAGIQRRLAKRMSDVGVPDFARYQEYLEIHPDEFTVLFDTLLINVTGFFRDPAPWWFVADHVVPTIVGQLEPDEPLRVWSAGCASGEEAYTLAILLAEALGTEQFLERVKIYATDLDESALDAARRGAYPPEALKDVDDVLRSRYFEESGGRFVFRPDLRRSVIFGRHDLVQDAPISRISLLSCRNTLMYFNAETQAAVLERFNFALRDGGFLVLGRAEMLLANAHLFAPVDLSLRVFVKVTPATIRERLLGMADAEHERTERGEHSALTEAAFDVNPVPELVLDGAGVVTLVNRAARSRLGVSASDIGRPFQDLELSYQPAELRSVISHALAERRPARISDVQWLRPKQEPAWFDIRVTPVLAQRGEALGVALTFRDVTGYRTMQQELELATRQAHGAYQELQSTNEELETTNEELQSTIEELETTNEELQSTNEELDTMNEELQSTNVELHTINDELRTRTGELNQVNAFLESILDSLRGAVAVLDADMVVQVWNRRAEDLWGLRDDEAHGQHVLSLDIGLPVDRLRQPLRACFNGDGSAELDLDAINRRGKPIRCLVRCSPLLGADGGVEGAILVMEDQPQE